MKSVHWQKWCTIRGTASFARRLMVTCVLILLSTIFFLTSPIQAQPTILPSFLPEAQVGVPYTASLVAAPVTPPCTWTITSGSLPPGLSLDAATGTILGTATTAGSYTFFVTVTDVIGTSSQQGFFITVTSRPISFITTSLPQATEGSTYTELIRVTGGTSPYTWTIVSGTLPSGLTLGASTGIISGTPARGTAGSHTFIIGVTDSSTPPLSGQQSFSIVIEKGSYESIVTIAPSLLAGKTKVFVGGEQVATLQGGESTRLSFDPGTSQTVTVDPIVSHPTKTDVRFGAELDRMVVSELSPNAHFSYYAEYFIEFKVEPPQVAQLTGSGWYKEGYALRASALAEIEDTPGTRYHFSYWLLPTAETVRDEDLSLTISMPGSIIANYDTYYQLNLISPYGEPGGGTWHKAGAEAQWAVEPHEVPMSGILGFFGGKLQAVNYSGTTIMDSPKTITITWEPDYTRPYIFIPLSLLAISLAIFGLYRRGRGLQPKPAPVAPTPQPALPPQTTVVVIGDASKQSPQTTRQQILEKLSELLEKYEEEIRASEEHRMLPAPQPPPSTIVEAEGTHEQEESLCNFTAKKLLRTVASTWRQVETKTTALPPSGKKTAASRTGLGVVWARDIYNEWEILTCSLPSGHTGPHQGSLQIVYTLVNTITEEKVYGTRQKLRPPAPHFTDGMPEVEVTADQVISPEQLPTEALS